MIVNLVISVVAAGASFTCTPTRVWDGDGPIWCAEGPKIRLAGIAAREIDETCRAHHPCPNASGRGARDHLVLLLGGARGTTSTGHVLVRSSTLRCRSEGSGKGARTAAWCVSPKAGDLSCAMVRSGYALKWKQHRGAQVCRIRS